MNKTIEADFFPSAVEIIKDTSHASIVDNDPDAAQSVELSLNKASGNPSCRRSSSQAVPISEMSHAKRVSS